MWITTEAGTNWNLCSPTRNVFPTGHIHNSAAWLPPHSGIHAARSRAINKHVHDVASLPKLPTRIEGREEYSEADRWEVINFGLQRSYDDALCRGDIPVL
jgi:hypothetical protein